jgi:glycogen operon protein
MISGDVGNGEQDDDIYVILNQWREPLKFVLPYIHGKSWYRVVDTSREPPEDFLDEPDHVGYVYVAQPHSSVILVGK